MLHVNSLYELYCAIFYHSALEWNDCDVTVVLDMYLYYNGACSFIVCNLFLATKNSSEPVQETSSHLLSAQRCCMQFCTAAPAGWPPPPGHQLVQVLGTDGDVDVVQSPE